MINITKIKMKFIALLIASAAAVNVAHIPVKPQDKEDFFDRPKTFAWERKLNQKTQGKPKTQEEIDASWDGDLGFSINMGGEKFDTKLNYDNNDKFQVQSIIDYYDKHDEKLKEPTRRD